MVKVNDLLSRIRSDIASKRYTAIDLAREAEIPPTTLYSMLDPDWSNRAVDNVQAISEALERITQKTEAKPLRETPARA